MELVVVDHHPPKIDLSSLSKAYVVLASSLEDFYRKTREYVKRDYDLVISDEDPDGITSVIIYKLYKKAEISFEGNRSGLDKAKLDELKRKGINTILAFDWYPFNWSYLDGFDRIVYINPRNSGLPNINASDIVHGALPETGKFGRDISTIGTVCDYLVDNCRAKVNACVLDYPNLFPELVELARENKLDRYNVYAINRNKTRFFDLSLMFCAPLIIDGREGNDKLIKLLVENNSFGLDELFTESHNPAVIYLRGAWKGLVDLINEEKENFQRTKKVNGKVVFYSMKAHRPGFMSKFSSIISEEYTCEEVIVMKAIYPEEGIVRYSLRVNMDRYNLGKIVSELGVGGGHENAAGATVQKEREEWFESELASRINNFI